MTQQRGPGSLRASASRAFAFVPRVLVFAPRAFALRVLALRVLASRVLALRVLASAPRALGLTLVAFLAAYAFAAPARAATLHVAPDGSGDYPTIQDAVVAAISGDTILLADGTFLGTGNKDVDLLGKTLIIASANGDRNAVVLDLENAGRAFVVSAAAPARPERRDDLPRIPGAIAARGGVTEIRGLTIRNGLLTSSAGVDARGGAINIGDGVSLVVDDVAFESNEAMDHGGAIHLGLGSWLEVTASEFVGNDTPMTGSSGGAIRCDSLSVLVLDGCRFEDNFAEKGGAVYVRNNDAGIYDCEFVSNEAELGAGVYARALSNVTIERSKFFGNVAASRGGAFYAIDPGVVATLDDCRLCGNSALGSETRTGGGAIFLIIGPELTVTSSLVSGNWSGWDGGAAYAEDATLQFVSTTIAGNHALQRGGAFYGDMQVLTGTQVVSWGNCAEAGGQEIYLEPGGSADLTCTVLDLAHAVGSITTNDLVTEDPLFCDPVSCQDAPAEGGNYGLQFGSPASADASPCGLLIGSEELSDCAPLCAPRDFISNFSVPAESDPSLWDDDVIHVVGDWIGGSLVHSVYGDVGAVPCGGTRVAVLDGPDRDLDTLLGTGDVFEDGSFLAVGIGAPEVDCIWLFAERDSAVSEGTRIAFDRDYPTVPPSAESAFLYDAWNPYRIYGSGDFVNLRLLADDPSTLCDAPFGTESARSSLLHVWADFSALDRRIGPIAGFGTPADSILLVSLGADQFDNDGDWLPFFDADGNGFFSEGDPLRDDVGLDGIPDTNDFGEGDGLPTFGDPFVDENGNGVFDPGETFLDVVTSAGGSPGDHVFDPGEPNLDSSDPDEFGWYELRSSSPAAWGTIEQGFPLEDPDPAADGAAVAVTIHLRDNGIDGGERPGVGLRAAVPRHEPDWNCSLSHVTVLDGSDPARVPGPSRSHRATSRDARVAFANESSGRVRRWHRPRPGRAPSIASTLRVDFTVRSAPGDPVPSPGCSSMCTPTVRGEPGHGPGPGYRLELDPNGDGFPGAALFDEDGDAPSAWADGFDDDEDGVVDDATKDRLRGPRGPRSRAECARRPRVSLSGTASTRRTTTRTTTTTRSSSTTRSTRRDRKPAGGYGRIYWYNARRERYERDSTTTTTARSTNRTRRPSPSATGNGARDDDEDGDRGRRCGVRDDHFGVVPSRDRRASFERTGSGLWRRRFRDPGRCLLSPRVRPPDGVDGETGLFMSGSPMERSSCPASRSRPGPFDLPGVRVPAGRRRGLSPERASRVLGHARRAEPRPPPRGRGLRTHDRRSGTPRPPDGRLRPRRQRADRLDGPGPFHHRLPRAERPDPRLRRRGPAVTRLHRRRSRRVRDPGLRCGDSPRGLRTRG
ncbi:MAG: right-handed parallel beta-helix repeat-containing protein [Candidatus Eisenbacteria bacterium]